MHAVHHVTAVSTENEQLYTSQNLGGRRRGYETITTMRDITQRSKRIAMSRPPTTPMGGEPVCDQSARSHTRTSGHQVRHSVLFCVSERPEQNRIVSKSKLADLQRQRCAAGRVGAPAPGLCWPRWRLLFSWFHQGVAAFTMLVHSLLKTPPVELTGSE